MALVLAACGGGGNDPPQQVELTVTIVGDASSPSTGAGRVTSTPAGVDCSGNTCNVVLPINTSYTLTATPVAGQQFAGWTDACSGTSPTCTISTATALAVGATFTTIPAAVQRALSVTVTGNGSVSSQPAGIACGTTCNANFDDGATVTLTATPAAGQILQAWGGACSGAAATCSVTMSQARSVSAAFAAAPVNTFALTMAVTGSGTVTSAPAGINCGSTCTASFNAATSVVLTATPAQGQVLQAWGGACSGTTGTCTVTMNQAQNASATFVAAPPPPLGWGTATLMESSNDFNVGTVMLTAMDPNGNGMLLWEQSDGVPDGGTVKVYWRRYVAGQGWTAAQQVPGLASTANIVNGKLLADAAGNVTWIRFNFETRRWTPSGGWSTAFLAPSGSGNLMDAKIDAAGHVHALGYSTSGLRHNRLPAGGTWGAWNVVRTDPTRPGGSLALSANGSMMAVWVEDNPGDNFNSTWAARFVNGAWQAAVRLEELLTNVVDGTAFVAGDANGNFLAVWHQANSLYVARFDGTAGTWGTPTERATLGTIFPSLPRVAMAADGRGVFTWRGNDGNSLMSMTYAPGAGFSTPVAVASWFIDPFLAMDDSGRAVVVYRGLLQFPNPTSAEFSLYAQELPWGGSWSSRHLMESGAGDVRTTNCSMNASGRVLCGWAQYDPTTTVRTDLWSAVRQ